MNEIKYISIDDEIPADKNKLCIFYDGEYYIDTYNNLSSTDQKQLLKWSYLPLIDEINIAHDDYDLLKDKINKIKDMN